LEGALLQLTARKPKAGRRKDLESMVCEYFREAAALPV
jgi:hypothetical protein